MGLVDWTFLRVFCRCVQLHLWDSIVRDLVLWSLGKWSLGSFSSVISVLATLARHLVCRSHVVTVRILYHHFYATSLPMYNTVFYWHLAHSAYMLYNLYNAVSIIYYSLYYSIIYMSSNSFICACTLLLCLVQYKKCGNC